MEQQKQYKIAVIGPTPRDHITTHRGEVIEKYGCITHPTIGLAQLLHGKGTVYPVTHIRKVDMAAVQEIFAPYPAIDTAGVSDEEDSGDVISLRFLDQNLRVEKQTAFMNPITPKDMAPYLDCDAFVFVPITDHEITLDTLKYLKEHSQGTIIFDAHGPTHTMTIGGDRHKKFWVERDLWIPYIDVLKMNLEESWCTWYKHEYDESELTDVLDDLDQKHLAPMADYVLDRGPKSVIVTTDSSGCKVFTKENGQLKEDFVPSIYMDNVVDTTGCGDSFAGGLAYGLKDGGDNFIIAAMYANALGAQRTQGPTFEVFKSLDETEQMIRGTYPDFK
ncbi:MAG: carbohydrate kinase family protein [Flavobacteriales bacterium]|nr:carbohydrate kinase family protein [Flavobacteriales bacterium]